MVFMYINNDYRYNKISQIETTAATIGGLYLSDYAAAKISSFALKPIMNKFYSLPEIPKKDANILIKSMLNNKKLKDLKIIEVTKQVFENIVKDYQKGTSFFSNKKESLKNFESVYHGRNAFYLPKTNKIYTPVGKTTMLLHEMGHALNNKAFWGAKYLQIAGAYLPRIAPVFILSSAIWDSIRRPNEKSFVKDNIGVLTAACFIPTLIDEGIASLRVIKNSIKNNMSKTIIKNQKKFLGLAFCSYLGLTVTSGIVATGLVKLASFYHDWRNKN